MIQAEFLNRVELRGYVGNDPAVFNVGGSKLAIFSVVTAEAYRGSNGDLVEEETWHNVSVWNSPILIKKGMFVSVVGRIRTCTYVGQDGQERKVHEIVAGKVERFEPLGV